MRKLFVGILMSCAIALSSLANAAEDYNGVWQGQLGYIMVRQNGNNVVATLLLDAGYYQAFYGSLDATGKKATLKQLFTTSKIELEVNVIDAASASVQLVTCNKDALSGESSTCLIPLNVPLPITKIF